MRNRIYSTGIDSEVVSNKPKVHIVLRPKGERVNEIKSQQSESNPTYIVKNHTAPFYNPHSTQLNSKYTPQTYRPLVPNGVNFQFKP